MSVVGCLAAGLLVLFGTLAFVHVAVKVDEDCLEVRCGHIGLPRRRIPLSQVAGADFVAQRHPAPVGRLGLPLAPREGHRRVVRTGEGVVLRLGDGRTFTVTVDDAESAVRVIRDRLPPGRRRGAGTGTDHADAADERARGGPSRPQAVPPAHSRPP